VKSSLAVEKHEFPFCENSASAQTLALDEAGNLFEEAAFSERVECAGRNPEIQRQAKARFARFFVGSGAQRDLVQAIVSWVEAKHDIREKGFSFAFESTCHKIHGSQF
jgi:hypothetical protein